MLATGTKGTTEPVDLLMSKRPRKKLQLRLICLMCVCPCAPIMSSPSSVLLLCVVEDGQSPWYSLKGAWSSQVQYCDNNPAMAEQACICRLTLLLLLETVPQQKQLGEVL